MIQEILIARDVIAKEIKGLVALDQAFAADSNTVGYDFAQSFIKALDLISNTKGKLIFSGIGKSGHIAKKIASTMSSIGIASVFLHAAEAGHGDLGTIGQNDVVILLSNSGSGQEVDLILKYCNQYKIALIGMTSNPNSILCQHSLVTLLLPKMPEADDHLPIPTVSSCIFLGLGHALIVSMGKRRQVDLAKYGIHHPNGSIGMKFVKVEEIMHIGDSLPLVSFDTDKFNTILMMTTKRMGCTGVVDDSGKLIGIITDGDLRRAFHQDFATAGEIMTPNPLCINQECLANDALQLMQEKMVQQLFIVQNNHVVGIVHWHDLLEYGNESR